MDLRCREWGRSALDTPLNSANMSCSKTKNYAFLARVPECRACVEGHVVVAVSPALTLSRLAHTCPIAPNRLIPALHSSPVASLLSFSTKEGTELLYESSLPAASLAFKSALTSALSTRLSIHLTSPLSTRLSTRLSDQHSEECPAKAGTNAIGFMQSSFIEDYILREVLPCYGNTHTTTSITSLQSTLYRNRGGTYGLVLTDSEIGEMRRATCPGYSDETSNLLGLLRRDEQPAQFTQMRRATCSVYSDETSDLPIYSHETSDLLGLLRRDERPARVTQTRRATCPGYSDETSHLLGLLRRDEPPARVTQTRRATCSGRLGSRPLNIGNFYSRHEAKDIFRNAVHASEHDAVIFAGHGCTGAVHKLIHALDLAEPPIVFVGPCEHHSNLLPWRERGAKIVRIAETKEGFLDLDDLEHQLQMNHNERRQLIGCFSAASNITGILCDDIATTLLLHQYGALAFWDYAAAGKHAPPPCNMCDDIATTLLLHQYGALAFWDYAAAGKHAPPPCNMCDDTATTLLLHQYGALAFWDYAAAATTLLLHQYGALAFWDYAAAGKHTLPLVTCVTT
uniref:Aminotransferase class V domain-containing protein n=1 Tax=Timema poppense TaxID=170557 RepID=A0A7R9H603_TIMPO|nr:unnamed protein product [Timema poppensis]